MNRSNHLNRVIAEIAKASFPERPEHPQADTLAAYHDGLLATQDAQDVLDHVQGCPDCASLLIELSELRPTGLFELEEDEVSPGELDQRWQALKSRLPAPTREGVPDRQNVVPFLTPSRPRVPPWYHFLAAGLLLAVGVQTVRLNGLHHELELVSQPEANVPLVALSDGRTRSGDPSGSPEPSLGQAGSVLLYISPEALKGHDVKTYDSFCAELSTGRRHFRLEGLKLLPQQAFTIGLNRRHIGPEGVEVKILGTSAGKEDMLGQFQLRLDSKQP